ncbi:MAG: protein kinase, partial [Kofleriaceae bacterium]
MCPGEEPIAAYAAGRLPRAERDAIDAHLDTCSTCSELVGLLAKGGALGSPDPIEPDRLLVGHLGRYVLLARIGVGGMGEVYAAYDPELDRRVALKLLHRARGDELHREARAIAKLAHPNVVAVFDVGRADDVPFVAMEHVDGVTLREWLRAPHKPTQILDAFVQAGRGLAAAHAAGLVHRDVKPSNLMIDRDGRTRVLDFGLADGSAGGTPGYMAPEQARGEPVDARADQYALCVALWEALSGERPGEPPVAKGMLAYVPDRAVRALRRGLSQDPAARFQTLDALLGELHPASRRHVPWLIGASAAIIAFTAFAFVTSASTDPCELAGAPIDRVWSESQRTAVGAAFAATKLPFATPAATSAIAELDAWTTAWRAGREDVCHAGDPTALREACLEGLLAQLRPVVALATRADPALVSRADALVGSLPAPVRCAELAQLAPLPPGELARLEVDAIRTRTAELEADLVAGHADRVTPELAILAVRADATRYPPIRARVAFLTARVANGQTRYTAAIAELHRAAQLATAARDLELLAEIWIELVKSLGNDVRTGDEAALFDHYVTALLPQLPDRATLSEQLEQARCTRNVTGAEVAAAAQHCATAVSIAHRPQLANAARTRLGHFQRMLGQTDQALATLHTAVTEAERVFGPVHPDTALAHYALGIALLSVDQLEPGIVELRRALEIRRRCFPDGGPAIAESLQG